METPLIELLRSVSRATFTQCNVDMSDIAQTFLSTSCPDPLACTRSGCCAGSLLRRTKGGRQAPLSRPLSPFLRHFLGTLAGAHLSIPRRKNMQPRAHNGRDRSQHPARHFINSLAVRGDDQHTFASTTMGHSVFAIRCAPGEDDRLPSLRARTGTTSSNANLLTRWISVRGVISP
jgi:hypothetical protein